MLRQFTTSTPPGYPPLTEVRGAHLVGSDGFAVRGNVALEDGILRGDSRSADALALSLLWPVPEFGTLQLQTTRLPIRETPYVLLLELARQRMLRINIKREEWGLHDYPAMDKVSGAIDDARDLFIDALTAERDPETCAERAADALSAAMRAGDAMTDFHADLFISRRQQSNGFSGKYLGVTAPAPDVAAKAFAASEGLIDFARIPTPWREIQPSEGSSDYAVVDGMMQAAKSAGLQMRAGPLLSFAVSTLPDWMYLWENDFDTVFDLAREHIERTVKRYGREVHSWVVASGLHASDALSLTFEHLVELTRAAATTTRKLAPNSQVIIDITQPWGEYFARNQRTVPPLLYAEMIAQSGIRFDAFGLQFLFGIPSDGYHLRDFTQISAMIDRYANLGRPLHITAVAAPSGKIDPGPHGFSVGGEYGGPWNPERHAEWLRTFTRIAMSKPYVESVCFQCLVDGHSDRFPACGIFDAELQPRPALEGLQRLRKEFATIGAG